MNIAGHHVSRQVGAQLLYDSLSFLQRYLEMSGSRDAVKPAEFFFFTTSAARTKQVEDAKLMLQNATFLLKVLRRDFPQLSAVKSNALSNTIYFKHPGDRIVKKYSLATMHLEKDGRSEEYAHVVVMPHVSREVLSEFLTDLGDEQSYRDE